jgi:hypothetical protein
VLLKYNYIVCSYQNIVLIITQSPLKGLFSYDIICIRIYRLGDLMVCVLTSSEVDRGLESQLGQAKDYNKEFTVSSLIMHH